MQGKGGVPLRLTVVVPTRNRSDLALRSIRSVLVRHPAVRVLVSDNSTDEAHRRATADAVAGFADDSIRLVRPPRDMPMTEHWEWALQKALADRETTHVLFLTDRMAFRRGAMAALLDAIAAFPTDVVSYTYDRIDDASRPVTYRPLPRSGALYRIRGEHLLALASKMVFYSCLPRMLNCAVPRGTLESLQTRFEVVFDSVAPDFCFCFRLLATRPSIIYLDRSLLVNYAQDRSNGASFSRGVPSRDSRDFIAAVGSRLNAASPLAEPATVGNAIVNEYCAVRAQLGDEALPALDWKRYLDFLGEEVADFRDPDVQQRALHQLTRHGWTPADGRWTESLRNQFVKAAVWSQSHRFASLEEALDFALEDRVADRPWLAKVVRRYGVPVAWPAKLRATQTDAIAQVPD